MEQKKIYMTYLVCGISFYLLLAVSCSKDVDYAVQSRWIYINTTNHNITYKHVSWSRFDVAPHDTTIVEMEMLGGKVSSAQDFTPALNPLLIYFDGDKCDTLYNDTNLRKGTGVKGMDNYKSRKLDNNYYEFIYYFTEEDYNKAHFCEQDSTGFQ